MLGAIAGDMVGSIYESQPIKYKDFPLFSPDCRFTDDTVLTVAIADAILNHGDYADYLKRYCRRYPNVGYGMSFLQWGLSERSVPYNSWGNGAAMRVSPVAYAFDQLERVLCEAKRTAEVTHNHPEGIKGAQATAAAIFLARMGYERSTIQDYISTTFNYDLSQSLDKIRPDYQFDISCQGSVPQAIRAFLESTSVEDAIRNAISLGGDSDTLACIAGSIAEAFYGDIPDPIYEQVIKRLDPALAMTTSIFISTSTSLKTKSIAISNDS